VQWTRNDGQTPRSKLKCSKQCVLRAFGRYSESNVRGIRLAVAYNIDKLYIGIICTYIPIIDYITLPGGTFLQRRMRIQYSSIYIQYTYIHIYIQPNTIIYLQIDLPVFILNNATFLKILEKKNTIETHEKIFALFQDIFSTPETCYPVPRVLSI